MSRKGFERIREHFLNLDSDQEDRSRISQYDKILWIAKDILKHDFISVSSGILRICSHLYLQIY